LFDNPYVDEARGRPRCTFRRSRRLAGSGDEIRRVAQRFGTLLAMLAPPSSD
jgi:hypothetical protein